MRWGLLEEAYEGAPTVDSGRHRTTVNEFTDQVPALRMELLNEVVERLHAEADLAGNKVLVEEDKGGILGTAFALRTGLPLAVARWYPYQIPGAIEVPLDSEYFRGALYLNGLEPGDRVIIVDDTISTGGAVVSLVEAARSLGAEVAEVLVAVAKSQVGGLERVKEETGVPVTNLIAIEIHDDNKVHVVRDTQETG